jgi:hypothetical protein
MFDPENCNFQDKLATSNNALSQKLKNFKVPANLGKVNLENTFGLFMGFIIKGEQR